MNRQSQYLPIFDRFETFAWHLAISTLSMMTVSLDETASAEASAEEARTTTVGMPGRIVDLILPGAPLEVIPIERDAPVVVRILQTIGHGPDKNRYELEYYCLEPGDYNLANYLRRSDGSTNEIPEIKVTVQSQLGAGQVLPNALISQSNSTCRRLPDLADPRWNICGLPDCW